MSGPARREVDPELWAITVDKIQRCIISQTTAADRLGLNRRTLRERLKEQGIVDVEWPPYHTQRTQMEYYAKKVSEGVMTFAEAAEETGMSYTGFRMWALRHELCVAQPRDTRSSGGCNICAECAEHFCEWIQCGAPVPGWTAEVVARPGSNGTSYAITECPKFRPMKAAKNKKKER